MRSRHVAAPIPVDPNRNLWSLDDQLIKRNLAAQQRNNTNSHIHAVGMKQGRLIRSFEAVHSEVVDFEFELPGSFRWNAPISTRAPVLCSTRLMISRRTHLSANPDFRIMATSKDGEGYEDQRRCPPAV